jgi:hypothetical protein
MLINPDKEIRIQLFYESENLLMNTNFFNALESCSLVGEQSTYSVERLGTGFILSAQNVDACVTVKLQGYLGSVIQGGSEARVYELSLGESNSREKQDVCVFDNVSGLCSNQPLKNGKTFFYAQNEKDYSLRFFARGKNTLSSEVQVEYSDIRLHLLSNKREHVFKPQDNLQKDLSFKEWRLEKDLNYSGNVTKLDNYPRVCNTGITTTDKSKITVMNNLGTPFIRYEARAEALCDSFEFPTFEHSSGAVLEIRSRNLEGMPMRVCLTNEYSKKCDLYVSLSRSGDFKTQYYLIPPMGEGRGYTVNISNLIFGSSVDVNDLEYVALVPSPYSFLKSIHKPLTANGEKTGGSSFVYNQAYEGGWIAWCGIRPCQAKHVLVNNWANGWVFTDSTFSESVAVFFWPQALEYVGFATLVVWFIALVGSGKHGEYNP